MILKIKKSVIYSLLAAFCVLLAVFVVPYDAISALSEQKSVELPIVMYHQLTKSESRAGRYVLTLEQFEKDLVYLKEKGYKTVTVRQLIDFSLGKTNLPENAVMITFDDGCETLYSYAKPLLEKYGFTAVGFIVGAYTDSYSEMNDHNLNYSSMTWSEIKELCQGGVIDIQSHTYDLHKNTGERSGIKKKKSESLGCYSEFLTADAVKMKERMLEYTGRIPVAVAYPFGSYSKESADILKKCGIEMAFTCEEKVNIIKKSESEWLFRLGRFNRPEGISSESFFEKMGIS